MSEPQDPNSTVNPTQMSADSRDTIRAAGAARTEPPRSVLGDMPPMLLRDTDGESSNVVLPRSDAMPPAAQVGDRYHLSGEIARGGMGAILRGRDVDLGRDVAVKVLLEKHANRPDVARRFAEEAQIGGQLQHPGVVPVYDIGRFGDRPYFTMKLVRGKTLAALLRERTDPILDRPRFLAIALQVAQTLAYAHAKGVIHRDLKPSNIMVGSFGEVQVMDWGLAKVLVQGGVADERPLSGQHERSDDDSEIRTARSSGSAAPGTDTAAGSMLGTPAYMPPEQARGANLDPRADVFGLGGILCEILTSKPPYVARSTEEVRRKAADGDLAGAYERLDTCGADVELVALTKSCLAREANDRPIDAQAVTDGLTAYLDGVQDRMHKAELAETEARAKAVEETKRRRMGWAWAGTVVLAVLLGAGVWLWVQHDRDSRKAQLARDVNDALNRATALREQSKSAPVGGAALFAQAREQAQRALALVDSGPADSALKEHVRRVQSDLDEEANDRALLAALDRARLAQSETLSSENRFAKERAVPLFREAFRTYGMPAGEGDPKAVAERIRWRPDVIREAIVAALDEWDDLVGNPRYALVEPHRDWVRAVLQGAEPNDGWMQKFRAAREEKDEVKQRAALEKLAATVDVESSAARALTRLASRLETLQAHASALKLLQQAQQHYPADFWVNNDLGRVLQEVSPPRPDDAIRFLSIAVALRPDSPGVRLNLGAALLSKGEVAEAMSCFRAATEFDSKYAPAHYNLGVALLNHGQADEALAGFRKAVELDPKHARALSGLGSALKIKGQLTEAGANFRKALALDPRLTAALVGLGNVLADRGRFDEAITSFRKAIDIDAQDARAYVGLGNALAGKGQGDKAIVNYRTAIALDSKYALAHFHLGNAFSDKGQLDEAIMSYRQAVDLDPNDPNSHGALGFALLSKGRYAESYRASARALELYPEKHPLRATVSRQRQTAERLATLETRLPRLIKREEQPASAQESLDVATMCQHRRLHATATRFAARAFAADPKLADDLDAGHRYNAACSAALAALGKAEDAAKLDDKARTSLRQQAVEFLRADLVLRGKQLDRGRPSDRAEIQLHLAHWQNDGDLAGIRDANVLEKLPADERAALTQFWTDVAALLKKAEARPK